MSSEEHMLEVERAMLCVSHAVERLGAVGVALQKDGAERHLVDAVGNAEVQIALAHRRLMQDTYYHVGPA